MTSSERRNLGHVNAFEMVTILVVVGTVVVGLADYLRFGGALKRLGRNGTIWFDHLADLPIDARPSEDEQDAPIPRRPLRGRF